MKTILNAIFFILRTGAQWRNLDEKHPPHGTVYHHFRKWKRDGRFEEMNAILIKEERKRQGRNKNPSLVYIDNQSVNSTSFTVEEVGFVPIKIRWVVERTVGWFNSFQDSLRIMKKQ